MSIHSWRSTPSKAFTIVKELAFPSTCAICDRRGSWLCDDCATDYVPMLPALCCDRCGHPLLRRRCECGAMHPAIVRLRSVAAYDGWPSSSLQRLKYDRERDRSVFLAEKMLEPLAALGPADVLVPVPLHTDREKDRGFNQSAVIASYLANATGMKVEHALVRVKPTISQTRLNREQRETNMKDAIELKSGWAADPSKHYVLVDDVYTTGSTSGACAEELSRAGIDKLSVLTFVFDLQPRDLEHYRRLVIAARC